MPESHEPRPLLVAFDDRPASHDALALGVTLAKASGEPLLLAWVFGPEPILFGMDGAVEARDHAERELDELRKALGNELPQGIATRALPGSSAAQALYRLADEVHPRAIVLGSCHHGKVGRIFAGSVGTRLLQGASCPVLVAPKGYAEHRPDRLRTICVGFDGGTDSWAALQHAARLGAAAGASLRLVAAIDPFVGASLDPATSEPLIIKRRRHAEVELSCACTSVSPRLRPEGRVVAMDARWALDWEAQEEDVDLIVVGSRGYGPLHRVFAGSVSMALMSSARCPVMVVPRSVEFDPTADGMAAADQVTA